MASGEEQEAGGLMLPSEVIEVVTSFLPLHDLSTMSKVSKGTRASLSIETVMLAAVTRTGDRNNTRKSMDEIYKLTSVHAIHPPSPMRLLRIATGNQCEFCFESHATVNHWAFGTFACWNCVSSKRRDGVSKCWNLGWARYGGNAGKYDAVFGHPRNAHSRLYGRKYYVWNRHRVIAGERVGPIMAWEDIDGAANYLEDTANPNDYEEKIDEYLSDRLHAPETEDYRAFNNAYLAAKAELADRTERAARAKAERKRVREENKVKREAEKLAKAERKRQREAAKAAKEQAKRAKKEEATKPAATSDTAGPVRRSRRNAGSGAADEDSGATSNEQSGPGENLAGAKSDEAVEEGARENPGIDSGSA